jgi:hypothetical protein
MDHEPLRISCPGCSGCPTDDCPPEHGADAGLLSGWRLVLAWMGVGLGPVVLAILASACAGEGQGAQFAAGLAGLGGGMIASVVVARRLRPAGECESTTESSLTESV